MNIRPVLLVILSGIITVSPLFAQRGGPPGGGRSGDASGIATVETGEAFHSITVAGRIEPRNRIVHRIPSAGFVQVIRVREGDTVAVGDELLRVRRRDDVLDLYQPVPLTARINGRVADVAVSVEAEVSSGDAAVTILGTDGFTLTAHVTDKDAFGIDIGQVARGRTSDGDTLTGTLEGRSEEPDYDTGLFTLTFSFPPTTGIHAGQFVMIDLPVDRVEGILIPRDAVVRRYGSFYVWTVTDEDILEAREVTTSDDFDGDLLVTAGLSAGDRYLPSPTGRERGGAPLANGER